MRKERLLGPRYGVMLLASITIAAVYFTTKFVDMHESYFNVLVGRVDQAFEEAYGHATITKKQ